jgi:hypothetical protein
MSRAFMSQFYLALSIDSTASLFATNVALAANTNRRQYAATKDGKRFLVSVPDRSTPPSPITVVLNWPAAIKP